MCPKNRRFRILSIDGGGIRGIFPAAVLAGLERHYTGGRSVASHLAASEISVLAAFLRAVGAEMGLLWATEVRSP